MHFDHIYSSDLERAKYTARCIAGEQEIIYTPQLREMNMGDWQGKTLDEIKVLYPEEFSIYYRGGTGFQIPGGESSHDLQRRAEVFIQEIAGRHPGETVLAVSHCGLIRAVFRAAMGIADFSVRPRLDNTAISGFRTADQGQNWQLLFWNDAAHLETMTESTAE